MKLPYLTEDGAKQQLTVSQFRGLSHRDPISAEFFFETQNLSSRSYPAAATRRPRGTLDFPALGSPGGLIWADALYWVDGTGLYREGIKVATLQSGPKQMVRMGAYLCIWPDKVRYHTLEGTLEALEASWTGSAVITENTIEAAGIGSAFEAYDGITISGAGEEANNKTAIALKVESGVLTFSDLCFEPESRVTLTLKREVPDLSALTELDNRLWGVMPDGHEIRACKLGDPKNWNCFEGIATDSYAVTVGTGGAFTAAAALQGYALLMKEELVHKMYGTKPANYQAVSQKTRGPMAGAAGSLAEEDGVLFYLARDGVVAYVGAAPERIGEALGRQYAEGAGGCAQGRYYLSARRRGKEVWDFLCYDIQRQCWYREDGTHALYFAYGDGALYYIDGADNRIKTVEGEDEEALCWAFETGDMAEGITEHKTLTRVVLDLELEAGGQCEVFIRYSSDGPWERVKTLRARDVRRVAPIPIVPRRNERFAIRVEGKGAMTLWAVERTVEAGTELGAGGF